jgi:hypothetical protein
VGEGNALSRDTHGRTEGQRGPGQTPKEHTVTVRLTQSAKTFTRSELELMLANLKAAEAAEAAERRAQAAQAAQPLVTRLAHALGKSTKSDWHGAMERLRFTDGDGADWSVKIVVTAMNDVAREKCT